VLALAIGLDIEFDPGSNCPGWIVWPGSLALASRFAAFWPAFAFALWRALALVMSSTPFKFGISRINSGLMPNIGPYHRRRNINIPRGLPVATFDDTHPDRKIKYGA